MSPASTPLECALNDKDKIRHSTSLDMVNKSARSTIAAIIPAYCEEKHVGDVVRRTRQQLEHVLVVDDGSPDQTATSARDAGAEVIVHPQNRGKGETIKTGLRYWFDRQLEFVIILDADGQHRPEEIDRFIA